MEINLISHCLFWTLEVSRTASYEINLVRLSVRLSVHPSVRPWLNFLKIGSLVFSDIVHDSWPWYLVTDEARFLKRTVAARIWTQQAWIRPKHCVKFGHFSSSVSEAFAIFLSLDHKFPLKLHTMIACDNIQHMLEVKPTKESGARTGAKRAKIRPEIRFFVISSSLHYSFSLILHMITAWDNF